jgi:hypothetical protein
VKLIVLFSILIGLCACSPNSEQARTPVDLKTCWSQQDLVRGNAVNGRGIALYGGDIALILHDFCQEHRMVVYFDDESLERITMRRMREAARDEWNVQPYIVTFSGVLGNFETRYQAIVLRAHRVNIVRRISTP